MQSSPDIHRIALLLSGMGPELAESALSCVEKEKAVEVRATLESFSANPPELDELNVVLDEFEVFMRFALKTAQAPSNWNEEYFSDQDDGGDQNTPGEKSSRSRLKIFQPSDDPIHDLQRLDPLQIAGALASEHSKTIGLVLTCLDNAKAAEVLDLLPSDAQPGAFFSVLQRPVVSPDLLTQVARTTVEKAALIEPAKIESPDADQKTADLLRALPKPTRSVLMGQLEESDPETAQRLQDLLYIFDDIVNYDNRSIQKLLGQFETQVLIVALEDVEPEISTRIFENLSKRAASALREEMEFKQASTPQEIEAARNEVAKLIAQLDRAGDLNELQ